MLKSPGNKKTYKREGRLLMEIYGDLLSSFGHRGWWPGDTPFEVCIGAILTQNTSWTNVEKAISNLKKAGLMESHLINGAGSDVLAGFIKPAGYFNVKAHRILAFVRYLEGTHGGKAEDIGRMDPGFGRMELLSVNGIGNETADSILLYAAGIPVFVVDAYTKRVFSRMGIIGSGMDYDEVQAFFTTRLKKDAELYKDYHAQIVELAKRYCRKSTPFCQECPVLKRCGFKTPLSKSGPPSAEKMKARG